MRIIEAKGQWLVNTGVYPLADAESGTIFQPGELTKAKMTDWVKSQSVIKLAEDPTAEAPKAAKKEVQTSK